FAQQLSCKFGAAPRMDYGVFRASALRVIPFLEIAGVMKQDGQQAEFKHSLREYRLRPCKMASPQQPDHAERSLQGVLKIMIPRIHRLIITVFPGKTLQSPAKNPRYE